MQATQSSVRKSKNLIRNYIAIARPDHWFKNIFMLPGIALAIILDKQSFSLHLMWDLVIAIVATCAIASANYTINEWLDAETDKFHPKKKLRPSVQGNVRAIGVYTQWALLSISGLAWP